MLGGAVGSATEARLDELACLAGRLLLLDLNVKRNAAFAVLCTKSNVVAVAGALRGVVKARGNY